MGSHTLANEIYRYRLDITRVVEYGVDFAALSAGEVAPPPSGARFDVWVAGTVDGRIRGSIEGCDYIFVRGDGRMELNVRATVTTDDGATLALHATGVGWMAEGNPRLQLRENATLFSSHEAYAWVNGLQVWAPGEVDVASGKIVVVGYGH